MDDPALIKNLKFNFFVNLLDGSFFGLGIGFASFTTIIPLFMSNLTDSAVLIGLIPAVHNMGWQLPQLLTARSVSRMSRFKPATIFWTIFERWPLLALGGVAMLTRFVSPTAAIILIFTLLVIQGIGAGLAANPWQNMISKIIPGNRRGTFFGLQSGLSNLLGGISAILAGLLLDRHGFPDGFSLTFLLCGISMAISFVFIAQTREPEHGLEDPLAGRVAFWGNIRQILTRDHSFRWFIISRFIFQFGMMATAFYTVYAVRRLGMDDLTAGAMTSVLFITQVASNTILGWLGDRIGHLPVLRLGAVFAVAAAALAWIAPSANWFFAVMAFAGVANTVFWMIGMVVTLDFGTLKDRPTYVGLSNTLIAPAAILAPLLGGWIADHQGYQTTFVVSAGFALISLLVLVRFVRKDRIPD